MRRVLIVDDEALFRQSLAAGLRAREPGVEVDVAANGREAVTCLARASYDLVLTDVKMPEIDGFELLAHMSRRHPHVSVLVMTAFGTDDMARRLQSLGITGYVEKPVDFEDLAARIMGCLARRASGFVQGLTLATFLQIVASEGKTCTLRCQSGGRSGTLHVQDGRLVGACAGELEGDAAALDMLAWEEVGIEILAGAVQRGATSGRSIEALVLDGLRRRDETARNTAGRDGSPQARTTTRREPIMALRDHLLSLQAVEGFVGAAAFNGTGETLDVVTTNPRLDMQTIGAFANNALLNAQKATDEMGVGRGNFLQIRAPQAVVLMRCLNEATDFATTQPGRIHIHAVVVVNPDGNVGMAGMLLDKTIVKMADELR